MAEVHSTHAEALSSSSHRLPTVAATQAFAKLRSTPARIISSGLPRLDDLLANGIARRTQKDDTEASGNGFISGHVTEIYGPPGSGKTSLCLQIAAYTLAAGHAVVWIDCTSQLPKDRLKSLLLASAKQGEDVGQLQEKAARFHHYTAADLSHLLALVLHPAPDFLLDDTALIIIDGISAAIDTAYSRVQDQASKKQSKANKWKMARKYAVMGELISTLQKQASMNSLVTLVTQQTRMSIRSGAGASLLPVLSSIDWDNAISTQLVLFRDFPPRTNTQPSAELAERWRRMRYAGVIKINGLSAEHDGRFDTVVPFTIEKDGLQELPPLQGDLVAPVISSPARVGKRRFEEIADLEDENDLESDDDYGLNEDIDFESGLGGVVNAS